MNISLQNIYTKEKVAYPHFGETSLYHVQEYFYPKFNCISNQTIASLKFAVSKSFLNLVVNQIIFHIEKD